MNLKRTLISTVAALGLAVSVMAPVAADDSATTGANVEDTGTFTYSLWASAISFGTAQVSTTQSATLTNLPSGGYVPQILEIKDTHSYNNEGWSLQMTAGDLTSESYTIENTNLSVQRQTLGVHSSCLGSAAPPVVGGNAYQTITYGPSSFTSLADAVSLATGSTGRGCGAFQLGYVWQLYVPAGTYTGEGTAVYTGSVTVSEVAEVGG
jgi:hypothetical protein